MVKNEYIEKDGIVININLKMDKSSYFNKNKDRNGHIG
jgi:hypothetical protein